MRRRIFLFIDYQVECGVSSKGRKRHSFTFTHTITRVISHFHILPVIRLNRQQQMTHQMRRKIFCSFPSLISWFVMFINSAKVLVVLYPLKRTLSLIKIIQHLASSSLPGRNFWRRFCRSFSHEKWSNLELRWNGIEIIVHYVFDINY